MVNETPYIGPEARRPDATPEQRRLDAEARWRVLVEKWKTFQDWQEVAFSEERPLGLWRSLMVGIYKAEMPLPRK